MTNQPPPHVSGTIKADLEALDKLLDNHWFKPDGSARIIIARILAAIQPDPQPVASEPVARVRHKKRGSEYEVIGRGKIQTGVPLNDYDEVVVYKGAEGDIWVRPVAEFEDGRFEPLVSFTDSDGGRHEWGRVPVIAKDTD